MHVLQAFWAAIRCTPIPPRNRRNRGGGNAAEGSGRNGAAAAAAGAGTRNINGLRGTGGTVNVAAGTRNTNGLRGTPNSCLNNNASTRSDPSGQQPTSATGTGDDLALNNFLQNITTDSQGKSFANRKSVCFRDCVIDDKYQRRHTISGSQHLARVSQQHITSINTAFPYFIDEVEQHEQTETEGKIANADEEVGMFEAVESPLKKEDEDNDDVMDQETGVLKDKAYEPFVEEERL